MPYTASPQNDEVIYCASYCYCSKHYKYNLLHIQALSSFSGDYALIIYRYSGIVCVVMSLTRDIFGIRAYGKEPGSFDRFEAKIYYGVPIDLDSEEYFNQASRLVFDLEAPDQAGIKHKHRSGFVDGTDMAFALADQLSGANIPRRIKDKDNRSVHKPFLFTAGGEAILGFQYAIQHFLKHVVDVEDVPVFEFNETVVDQLNTTRSDTETKLLMSAIDSFDEWPVTAHIIGQEHVERILPESALHAGRAYPRTIKHGFFGLVVDLGDDRSIKVAHQGKTVA